MDHEANALPHRVDSPGGSRLEDASTIPPGTPGSVAPATTVPVIPGYDIVQELGRGGMGVVYLARQIKANRLVALKMVLAGGHAGEVNLARFRAEAEAIARLQHPNIVQIFEVGEHHGLPYFSLEYCQGGSLAKMLHGVPLAPRDAALLVEQLARGVHAAHLRGIIHRDLKPGNVLIMDTAPPSAVLADGNASTGPRLIHAGPPSTASVYKITDFGLAKNLDHGASLTNTGAIMGTPSYMAPEQAAGKTKEVGAAADIYALGAILYECLTGRPPFRAATDLDTVLQVIEREPVPPSLLNPTVARDLETVCLKCLQKDPTRRYPTADALADDLRSWANGDGISARSYNLFEWMSSTLKRSQYDVQFAAWGSMLLWFAVFVFAGMMATAIVISTNAPGTVAWITAIHAVMFAAMGGLFWRRRTHGWLPSSTAERQLWMLLGGFVLTCSLLGVSDRLMATPEHPHDPLDLYPRFAIVSGLTFFVLGSSYWGSCYLFGAGFWVLALAITLMPQWGPAGFGLMWCVALVCIGRHLRRLGAAAAPLSPLSPLSPLLPPSPTPSPD